MSDYLRPSPERMRDCPGDWLFADGGVIAQNPSPYGGTWCWIRVKDGQEVARESGVLTPETIGLDAVSNNISELYAVVRGVASLPDGWTGCIVSDSHVTLCRRYPNAKMNGVPDAFIPYARKQFSRVLRSCEFVLADGHPTAAHLASGIGKRGNPVSRWNVACDAECTRVAEVFGPRPRYGFYILSIAKGEAAPRFIEAKNAAVAHLPGFDGYRFFSHQTGPDDDRRGYVISEATSGFCLTKQVAYQTPADAVRCTIDYLKDRRVTLELMDKQVRKAIRKYGRSPWGTLIANDEPKDN